MINIFKNIRNTATPDTTSIPAQSAPIIKEETASEQPSVVAIPPAEDTSIAGSASDQVKDAMAHNRECKLTIGEAQDTFRRLLRQPLSRRSLQRYCQSGVIYSVMMSHSQGSEWMVNETSLINFIEKRPITLTQQSTPVAPITATSTPKDTVEKENNADIDAFVAAPTARSEPSTQAKPDIGDDSDDYAELTDPGETRRIGELLIENARLLAIIDGHRELIETLKTHDTRSHEEVIHSRQLISKLTDDVRDTSAQMLDTVRQMATARFMLPTTNDDEAPAKQTARHTRRSVE